MGRASRFSPEVRERVCAAIVVIAVVLGASLSCAPKADRLPSIFVYLIDTLRPDHLGCYGYARPVSPRIDALAADGFVFSKAVSPSPWTRPAVASLFTGLPPSLHGVKGRAGWLPGNYRTWAEALSELGYRTEALVTNRNVDRYFGFAQGFETYEVSSRPGAHYARSTELLEDWLALPRPEDGRPEFHYLHTVDPHRPYRPLDRFREAVSDMDGDPTANWRGREDLRATARAAFDKYDAEILQSDTAFGLLVDELVRRRIYDKSWIIVISDHGEQFWEHGIKGHGNGLWETLLRVALIVKPPGGRSGAIGQAIAPLTDRPFPIDAVADLIGPFLQEDWSPLGESNARLLDLDPKWIAQYVPAPGHLVPPVRRASVDLDTHCAIMVERENVKLIWNSRPERILRCFDLQADPGELARTASDRTRTLVPSLYGDMKAWFERTARGLELRHDGPDTQPLQVTPSDVLREAALPPGDLTRHFEVRDASTPRAEEDEGIVADAPVPVGVAVAWTPGPTSRVLLRSEEGARWTITFRTGEEIVLDPAAPLPDLPHGLTARWRDFGHGLVERVGGGPLNELPDRIIKPLRALGYVK